jgi:hypothetical protein
MRAAGRCRHSGGGRPPGGGKSVPGSSAPGTRRGRGASDACHAEPARRCVHGSTTGTCPGGIGQRADRGDARPGRLHSRRSPGCSHSAVASQPDRGWPRQPADGRPGRDVGTAGFPAAQMRLPGGPWPCPACGRRVSRLRPGRADGGSRRERLTHPARHRRPGNGTAGRRGHPQPAGPGGALRSSRPLPAGFPRHLPQGPLRPSAPGAAALCGGLLPAGDVIAGTAAHPRAVPDPAVADHAAVTSREGAVTSSRVRARAVPGTPGCVAMCPRAARRRMRGAVTRIVWGRSLSRTAVNV